MNDELRKLAGALACAITIKSSHESDLLAKNGEESVYSTIRRLVPQVKAELMYNFSFTFSCADLMLNCTKFDRTTLSGRFVLPINHTAVDV
jgi:hypothetical protein